MSGPADQAPADGAAMGQQATDQAPAGQASADEAAAGQAPAGRWAAARDWRLVHLPVLLTVSAVLAAAAAVAGGFARGGAGAIGAALGVAVVTLSYTLSTVVMAWGDSVSPQLVLPFGLGLYVTKFTLLAVLMAAVAGTGWPGFIPLCLGIAAGVVAWTGAHIWWISAVHTRRSRPDAAA